MNNQEENRLFIGWSGELSQQVALELYNWIPGIIEVKPWISEMDIYKGSVWPIELVENLGNAKFGLICLTPDNLGKPWLLFEAGALSQSLKRSVCTFLFHVRKSDVGGPLALFQHTEFNRDDILKLVHNINSALTEKKKDERIINNAFNGAWKELERRLNDIIIPNNADILSTRSERDILEEILELVRTQSRFSYDILTKKTNLELMSDLAKTIDPEWESVTKRLNEEMNAYLNTSKRVREEHTTRD